MKAVIGGHIVCPGCRRILFRRKKAGKQFVMVCTTPGCENHDKEVEEPTIELREVAREGA